MEAAEAQVEARSEPWARRDWVWLGLIAIGAIGLRLWFMLQLRGLPLFDHLVMDGRQYYTWADLILAGDWLSRAKGVFYQAPLYPYFLAITRAVVGDDLWNIRLVQIVLGGVSCGLIYGAARLFFGRRAAIVAGVGLALYPPAVFYDILIQKAGIGLLWMSLLLFALALVNRRVTVWRCVLLGVAQGLLMLTREETILLTPVLGLAVVVFALRDLRAERREPPVLSRGAWIRAILMGAAVAVGMAIVLAPVAFRNLAVGGEFVLTTSQAGSNFYIGNNPKADGKYNPLRAGRSNTPWEGADAKDLAERAIGRELSPREVSRYWFGESWKFISGEPGKWVRLMVRKADLMVNWYEVPDSEDLYFFAERSGPVRWLERMWNFGVLLPVGAAGMVLVVGRVRGAWVLALVLGTICAGVVMFYVFGRYRFPMAPVLMLTAAAAIPHAIACWMERRRWRLAGAAVMAAVLGVVANRTLHERGGERAMQLMNCGAALAASGDFTGAIPWHTQAVTADPKLWMGHVNLASARGASGDGAGAVEAMRAAAAIVPNDPQVLAALGNAMVQAGQSREAVGHLLRSLSLFPDDPYATRVLGMARERLTVAGYEGAVLRAKIALDPTPENGRALAWFFATCPEEPERNPEAALAIITQVRTQAGPSAVTPELIDTLGAAHARLGRFEEAIAAAEEGVRLAERVGRGNLATEIRERIALYRAGTPYTAPAAAGKSP